MQELGQIVTREGRLLAFPNAFQHRAAPSKLEDPSKPGHRKILALFLIDPHCRIISTANVPPQQKNWWDHEIRAIKRFAGMAEELVDQILANVDDFPISTEEAKELRLELMKERKVFMDEVELHYECSTFYFCKYKKRELGWFR